MTDDALRPRLEKIEDAQAFTDRTAEQLSEQLAALFDRVDRLAQRFETLEERLMRIEEQGGEDEAGAPAAGGGGG